VLVGGQWEISWSEIIPTPPASFLLSVSVGRRGRRANVEWAPGPLREILAVGPPRPLWSFGPLASFWELAAFWPLAWRWWRFIRARPESVHQVFGKLLELLTVKLAIFVVVVSHRAFDEALWGRPRPRAPRLRTELASLERRSFATGLLPPTKIAAAGTRWRRRWPVGFDPWWTIRRTRRRLGWLGERHRKKRDRRKWKGGEKRPCKPALSEGGLTHDEKLQEELPAHSFQRTDWGKGCGAIVKRESRASITAVRSSVQARAEGVSFRGCQRQRSLVGFA
jgi:hypothetical protein